MLLWIRILSLIGIFLSSYLVYIHYNYAYCLSPDSCIIVNTSEYSEILGIPVAFLGVLYFAYTLVQSYFKNEKIKFATLLLSVVAFAYGLYLSYVQYFILKEVCIFCELTKVVIFAILLIVCIECYPSLKRLAKSL